MRNVERIFQWGVVGWVIAFLVPLGFVFVSFKEYGIAKLLFAVSLLFLAGKFIMWDYVLELPLVWRFVACCLVFGSIGFAFVESVRWVDRKRAQVDNQKATEISKKSEIITPPAEQKRLRIKVCSFDGPDESVYRVTDLIVVELRKIASEYEDVDVVVGKSISAEEGSATARRVGHEGNAAIVLWGWYSKTKETALITVHFELLKSIPEMPTEQGSEVLAMAVGNLEKFEMQISLSKDIRYLASVALALTYYGESNYDFARELLTEAINISRTSSSDQLLNPAVTYFYRGVIYNFEHQFERAIQDFDSSINLSPNPSTYLNRSNSHFAMRNFDKARVDLLKAIEMAPKLIEAYVNLGIVEFMIGNPEKAVEMYNRALTIDDDPLAYFNRSVVNMLMGQEENAINDLNAAIKIYPEYAKAFQNRAAILVGQGRFKEAMLDLNQAIELEPQNATLYFNRAGANLKQDRSDLAFADFEKVIALDPKRAEAYYYRGIIYGERNQNELAMADLTEAIRLVPLYGDAYIHRGTIYAQKKDYDRAIADFNKVIEIIPETIIARQGRFHILISKHKYDEAISDLEFIIKKSADNKKFQEETRQILIQVKQARDEYRKQQKSTATKN